MPGESHGGRSLVGSSPWGRKESDTTERLHFFSFMRQSRVPLGTRKLSCFPDSLAGKETTCKAEDPGSILGSGRSSGEVIGYPRQYSWASLVAQLIKNPPAMWETWVRSLGWEDPREKGTATHSSILTSKIPWTV